jgi:linoleate 10R-lipoxygenase
MADKALGILYNTVPHPPAALLGQEHAFRAADGKGNNLQDENYGRAGTGYARSVQPQFCVAPTSLPDPGLIFDTLLKRRGHVDHPSGISSFTFAFATLVTHSVFRTDPLDPTKNDTSSYLDLSPLYGHSE